MCFDRGPFLNLKAPFYGLVVEVSGEAGASIERGDREREFGFDITRIPPTAIIPGSDDLLGGRGKIFLFNRQQ
jgi:hypothetical protein